MKPLLSRRLRGLFLFAPACLVLAAVSSGASAETWPTRPIRLVVPFTSGGIADIMSRVLAEKLKDDLGQPVIVDNRPGAGTLLASDFVQRADPDGYTLLMAASALTIAPSVYPKGRVRYDPTRDFAPVSLVAEVPQVLVVSPSLPVHTVGELLQYAKAHAGQVNYASAGTGTSNHLGAEHFKQMAHIGMTHVAYKGTLPGLNDVMAGNVQVMFADLAAADPFIKSGRLRALGLTNAKASVNRPEIPAISQSGVPGYDSKSWLGIVAPAGTPPAVLMRLNESIVKALRMPEVKQRFDAINVDVAPSTPAEFGRYIATDTAKWAKIARDTGASVE